MRATDDAELHARVHAFVPTFREIVAALDALQAEREAAKAAPVLPPPAPAPLAPALPQGDLQTLVQQALQQALAAQANGTPPPVPPSNGTVAHGAAQPTPDGWCTVHQVQMERRQNERGSWYSHWLPDEQRHCKGRR